MQARQVRRGARYARSLNRVSAQHATQAANNAAVSPNTDRGREPAPTPVCSVFPVRSVSSVLLSFPGSSHCTETRRWVGRLREASRRATTWPGSTVACRFAPKPPYAERGAFGAFGSFRIPADQPELSCHADDANEKGPPRGTALLSSGSPGCDPAVTGHTVAAPRLTEEGTTCVSASRTQRRRLGCTATRGQRTPRRLPRTGR